MPSSIAWYRARHQSAAALVGAILVAFLGCERLQWQALRIYMAANPHLEAADGPRPYRTESEDLWLVPIVDRFEFPWGLAFLDEREALVTEKPGRLTRVVLRTGEFHPISGIPEVAFLGQGGLLGVTLDPGFLTNRWVYLAYAIAVPPNLFTTRVSRARLRGDELVDLEVLLTAQPALSGSNHFGGALAFDGHGDLFASVGERDRRDQAQDLESDLGKIHRIRPDGTIPDDNPFVGRPRARGTIFSLGHRNPQGLTIHPETGELWESEHGPQGGDEINVIRRGRNYGWPIISHGEEYGGGTIGVGESADGLEQPIHYYVPSIAPGGIDFYRGGVLRSWRGNLLVSGLRLTHLNRLVLDGESVLSEERIFVDLWQRIRTVRQSPFTTELFVLSENGVLFRIDAPDS